VYERFTDRARKVMQLANQEAQRFNHEYIGTEHILLGLVKEGSGVAANVLKNLDIDLRKIRLEVGKIVQPGPDRVVMGRLPQTPRAKKVIEYSIEEARNLNHNYVGTEHLLLGLLREQEGAGAQVLLNLGLNLDLVRREVSQLLGTPLRPSAGPEFRRLSRELRQDKPRGSSDPVAVQLPQLADAQARLLTLERQLVTVRFLLGAALGVAAGLLAGGREGALVGLLAGASLAYLGRLVPAALAGGLAGALVGAAHLADLGGGYAGAALGALLAGCVAEVGRPPRPRPGAGPAAKSPDNA
jgi:hypothetical protein